MEQRAFKANEDEYFPNEEDLAKADADFVGNQENSEIKLPHRQRKKIRESYKRPVKTHIRAIGTWNERIKHLRSGNASSENQQLEQTWTRAIQFSTRRLQGLLSEAHGKGIHLGNKTEARATKTLARFRK